MNSGLDRSPSENISPDTPDDADIRRSPPVPDLAEAREYLRTQVEFEQRPLTGKGRPSPLEIKQVTAKLPASIIERLDALKGDDTRTCHLEKAIKLYLQVLEKT